MSKNNGWTPQRSGRIYCSPLCGWNCTWADYRKACKDASKLQKQLGKGWKNRVWDNLGWHYEVIDHSGLINVSTHSGQYCALIDDKWSGWDKTPDGAIRKAAARASDELGHLKEVVSLIEMWT